MINPISNNTALNSVDSLLKYIDQWEFEYNDIIALSKFRTDIKKSLKDSCKQTKITDFLNLQAGARSFVTSAVARNLKDLCDISEIQNTN